MSKVAFVFPGQGTQFVGMGKELYENNEKAREYFDGIFSITGDELKEVMFNGPEEKLKITKFTQPAVVAYSLVIEKLFRDSSGIIPDYIAGHSLGEYSALGASGVLTMESCVRLAEKRGEIMSKVSEQVNGTMSAVLGLDSDRIADICKGIEGVVELVNFNEPLQTVIAGEVDSVRKAGEILKEAGAKRVLPLAVSGPFHSSLMKPAGDALKDEFNNYQFNSSKIPIVANTSVKLIGNEEEIKHELYVQTFGPVRWVETISFLKELGVTKIFEIGPGKVLNGLIKKIDKNIEVINIEKTEL